MLRSMKLKSLNPHITCVLCGGYLVDATTIIECLHSFCRSCIIRWLQKSYHCPVCETEIHKTRPFLNIRPDRVLQDIVYKLVPGFYHDELQRRKDFEEKLNEASKAGLKDEADEIEIDENERQDNEKKDLDLIEDPVCVTLEYYGRKRFWKEKTIFPTRYLRCSSKLPVDLLKKFVTTKFGIPQDTHSVEIVRCDEILSDYLTMKELWRIYGLHTKTFIDLQYIIIDKKIDTQIEELPKRIPVIKIKKRRRRKQKSISSNDGTSIAPVKRKRQRRIGRICKKIGLSETTDTSLTTLKSIDEQNMGNQMGVALLSNEENNTVQPASNISQPDPAKQNDNIKMDTFVCPVTPESDTDHTVPTGTGLDLSTS
ncbi:polycomb complex protein BMI-1-like [Actinia tenebrosa]|uniref:Polycomb complex protein BMI-1-like n=1 Tax=Actinia tenebrosa TaxID=6105 RepID=A0A6P8IYP2_ACTTE|nr:polycomb complex protein BMI-1-like [Actinia tenebrosa]XP_031570925.1 polycomb complex protein BMI-1-like [Actinia tenebrosa]